MSPRNLARPSALVSLVCAALAGCISDRAAQRDDYDYPPPPAYSQPQPQRPIRPPPPAAQQPAPPPPRAVSAEAQTMSEVPAPNDPAGPQAAAANNAQIKSNAAKADAEVDAESAAHGRPVISNLDETGAPLPGSTGTPDPADQAPQDGQDDQALAGAPGATASPDQLSQAWPGSKPADVPSDPTPPAPLPYNDPNGAQPQADAQAANDTPPAPGAEVDPQSFERPLAPYGRWVDTPDYGRVWIPNVDANWQPYTGGTWQNTEYGWTFVSYDPWAWAVWHYGRWGFRAGIGWYWVPGRVWGPAWVSWRWGGGYACWRPLGPWGVWGPRWGYRGWIGVPAAHFTEPIRGGILLRGPAVRVAVYHSASLGNPIAHPVAGSFAGPRPGDVRGAVGHPIAQVRAAQAIQSAHIQARSMAAARARGVQENRSFNQNRGGNAPMRENRDNFATRDNRNANRPVNNDRGFERGGKRNNAQRPAPQRMQPGRGGGGNHGGGHNKKHH